MVSQPARHRFSSMRSSMSQPTEMVKDYPLSSMLVVFGLGLGVGVLLSQAIAEPVMRAMAPEPSMMEKLGRQMYDALHHAMPDALARRMPA